MPKTKKLIVGNWKMNPRSSASSRQLAGKIERGWQRKAQTIVEVVVCPPVVFLPAVHQVFKKVKLGVQTVTSEPIGAFTGEVSIDQVLEFGIQYAILGHSERRAMGESDGQISRKIQLVQDSQVTPILCVGYGTKRGDSVSRIKQIVRQQIVKALRGTKFGFKDLVVAYEPVWAIGTGLTATPDKVAEVAKFIKSITHNSLVLYGGSTSKSNISSFANQEAIDGVLVGGASLKPQEFLQMIKAFSSFHF